MHGYACTSMHRPMGTSGLHARCAERLPVRRAVPVPQQRSTSITARAAERPRDGAGVRHMVLRVTHN